jgi:hypothetical protein
LIGRLDNLKQSLPFFDLGVEEEELFSLHKTQQQRGGGCFLPPSSEFFKTITF